MDKNKYTPEEEAYLRMLDQEVPDLWGRIEAGLDRTAYQNPPMMDANAAVVCPDGKLLSLSTFCPTVNQRR